MLYTKFQASSSYCLGDTVVFAVFLHLQQMLYTKFQASSSYRLGDIATFLTFATNNQYLVKLDYSIAKLWNNTSKYVFTGLIRGGQVAARTTTEDTTCSGGTKANATRLFTKSVHLGTLSYGIESPSTLTFLSTLCERWNKQPTRGKKFAFMTLPIG